MISVITPSRGRPDLAEQHYQSIFLTASSSSNVELLLYVDDDDPMVDAYRKHFEHRACVDLVIGPHLKSIGVCWNVLARRAKGDLIMMGNDDFSYVSKDWDIQFETFTQRIPDSIFVLCPLYPDNSCSWFPVTSKKWVEILGTFTSESFKLEFHDQWMIRIAVNIGRFGVLSNIITLHEPAFDETRAKYGIFDDIVESDKNTLLEEERRGVSRRLEMMLLRNFSVVPLPQDVQETFKFYSTAYRSGQFDKVDLVSRRPRV